MIAGLRQALKGERLALTRAGELAPSALAAKVAAYLELGDDAALRFGLGDRAGLKVVPPPAGVSTPEEEKEMREWARQEAATMSRTGRDQR